jgi:hypothetical protein
MLVIFLEAFYVVLSDPITPPLSSFDTK